MSEIKASHTYYKRKIFRRTQKPEWAKRPAIHVQESEQENRGFRPATHYRPLNFQCLGDIKPIYSNASHTEFILNSDHASLQIFFWSNAIHNLRVMFVSLN
jgi:hypothetical protein